MLNTSCLHAINTCLLGESDVMQHFSIHKSKRCLFAEYSKFMSCGQCSFGFGFCIFGTSEGLIKYAKKEGLNGPIYGLGGMSWWMK